MYEVDVDVRSVFNYRSQLAITPMDDIFSDVFYSTSFVINGSKLNFNYEVMWTLNEEIKQTRLVVK